MKRILVPALLFGVGYLGYRAYNAFRAAEQFDITVPGLPKNFKLDPNSLGSITFDLPINIANRTATTVPFKRFSGKIKDANGVTLSTFLVDGSNQSIKPGNNGYTVPFSLPVGSFGQSLIDLINGGLKKKFTLDGFFQIGGTVVPIKTEFGFGADKPQGLPAPVNPQSPLPNNYGVGNLCVC